MADFFYMGGFGVFVWSCMGITFSALALELLWLKMDYKRAQNNLRQQQTLKQ